MSLKQLVRTRDSIKLRLENLKLFVSTLDTEKPTISDVQFRIESFTNLNGEFDEIKKCADLDLTEHYTIRTEFENDFFQVMGILKHYLEISKCSISNTMLNPVNTFNA